MHGVQASTEHGAQSDKLPVEIIAGIIATVADDPDCPLADASLVSREWNATCRPHIFRKLIISSRKIHHSFHFLNFEAPHLSEYIRSVYIWSEDDRACTALEW